MGLPQELIDEVIRNLASDTRSLRSCSLVARSWTYPSRKWLFNNIILSKRTHQLWLDRISPRNVDLLHNVRAFVYVLDTNNLRKGTTPYRIDSLYSYLPSLHSLGRLGLYYTSLGPEVPQNIGLFSALQLSLSSLSLSGCRVTSSALITLINCFPLLTYLALRRLIYEADDEPAPHLSRSLRGTLSITGCKAQDRALFNRLSNPAPELDQLVLRQVHPLAFYDCIVGAHGGSVRRLKMGCGSTGQECTSYNFQISQSPIRNINL